MPPIEPLLLHEIVVDIRLNRSCVAVKRPSQKNARPAFLVVIAVLISTITKLWPRCVYPAKRWTSATLRSHNVFSNLSIFNSHYVEKLYLVGVGNG